MMETLPRSYTMIRPCPCLDQAEDFQEVAALAENDVESPLFQGVLAALAFVGDHSPL